MTDLTTSDESTLTICDSIHALILLGNIETSDELLKVCTEHRLSYRAFDYLERLLLANNRG